MKAGAAHRSGGVEVRKAGAFGPRKGFELAPSTATPSGSAAPAPGTAQRSGRLRGAVKMPFLARQAGRPPRPSTIRFHGSALVDDRSSGCGTNLATGLLSSKPAPFLRSARLCRRFTGRCARCGQRAVVGFAARRTRILKSLFRVLNWFGLACRRPPGLTCRRRPDQIQQGVAPARSESLAPAPPRSALPDTHRRTANFGTGLHAAGLDAQSGTAVHPGAGGSSRPSRRIIDGDAED